MPDGAPLIDPDIVAGRIVALLNDRRPGAVKPLLAALERLAPDHRDLTPLRVSYCCQIGDIAQALKLLEEAIAGAPENPLFRLRRAEILFAQAGYADAAADAAEAVLAAPNLVRAKSVLGLALLELGQFKSAIPCLVESFEADPASVDVALALAALAPENAVRILQQAIAASPNLTLLRNALTRRYLCFGDIAQALRNAEQTREDGLADAESFCLLAFAQMQEGGWDDAGISAAQAQSLAPGNLWAARLIAALNCRISGEVSPLPQQDALAAEQALFSGGTILPGAFRALLQESKMSGPVIDIFCGTGLNAIAARDIAVGPWTGIDPDPGLLELCAERGLYAQLENCGPQSFFSDRQYPIILLNQALGYAASPQFWFSALRAGLAPRGIALAAIPTGRPGLSGHGLFAHSLPRIAEQAMQAGLACRVARTGILRHIENIPLHGAIVSFQPI